MPTIERTFFCDQLVVGQFKKVDLRGYNPFGKLAIAQSPYNLVTNLVVEGKVASRSPESALSAMISYRQPNKTDGWDKTVDIKAPPNGNEEPAALFAVIPIVEKVGEGTMQIAISFDGQGIFEAVVPIVIGDSPFVGSPIQLPQSQIVTSGDATIFQRLLGMVGKELIVADPYLEPTFFYQVASMVKAAAKIIVFVAPGRNDKCQKEYVIESAKIRALPQQVEIRVTKAFHDRFVVIDGTEFYHFGYSVKDLWKKDVVWRYDKITSLEEVDMLRKTIAAEVAGAKPLF